MLLHDDVIHCHDYLLVKYPTNRRTLHYIGKVESCIRFPDLQDISTVSREDIVSKIPKQHQELQGSIIATSMKVHCSIRDEIIKQENGSFSGGKLELTVKEESVNNIILSYKHKELDDGYKNSSSFSASKHFFDARSKIEESHVFKIIQQLPKGASLHTHVLAGVSIDFIVEKFTYMDNIYGGFFNGVFKLKFFKPGEQYHPWKLLKDYRKDANFDDWLKTQLSLVYDTYDSVDDIWAKFKKTFSTMYDMICYKPVFEMYIEQFLNELYKDNVVYTEVKGTFMPLYDLNGTKFDTKDFFRIFINTVEKFKKSHTNFVGLKYIHSIYRGVNNNVLKDGLDALIELKKEFPDFIAGFDFVGYEEEGHSLHHYRKELLNASKFDLKFFFHAGETNWFGHTDLNLIDAMLMNSTRIGHGFALPKHPELIKMGITKNIPLELCPISNQVLKLIEDPRNHPLTSLLAINYPIVICNDDPALWNATGVSYDWYVVFMTMTPKNAGLGFLKQMALNSLQFSVLSNLERSEAFNVWERQWDRFLDNILANHNLV
ncbi:unnamed protein product [Brassicogethes aeneus]|uniref:Adenosine deaminase n=1 Tax=Brassicogethes aeneus TaxID=1431903 RepID=A0A9P0ARY6_BRAAE|nr:unnamed protein product [Brassicogethes aeneus]